MTLTLCGLPGCGKTTVGLQLARMTNNLFIDIDTLIEKCYFEMNREPLTCRQIFALKGHAFFRAFENQVIASLAQNPIDNSIISLGGGAIELFDNVTILKSMGLLIYLKVDLKELFVRINKKGLPAYLDSKDPFNAFEKLAEKRNSLYRNSADIEITGDSLTPEDIATLIIERVKHAMCSY